jgi:predicted ATPase/DNA-binding CsgD family transcriptional regulator
MTSSDDRLDDFPLEPLTWREEEILGLLVERQTNSEIAKALNISLETVKWYNQRLFAKLGANNRREAAERARALGLQDLDDLAPTDPKHNLPAQITPFVGRQRELEDLSELLAQKNTRLVTLLAPGGMGKTRLAIKTAEQCVSLYPDGVFFVPITELGSADHLASVIAESIDLALQPGRNPRQQVLQYLRNRRILLLLDNFERALGGAGLIGEMLLIGSGIRVLATSRERLNLSSETIYPVEGLAVPSTELASDETEEHDAIELFLESAKHIYPAFKAQADDWESIMRICQLVDGMPLGIVLAAMWVQVLSPAEIASEITNDFDILSTDLRDVPHRQRSIRAVFESTWRRLSGTARRSFEKLSVFRGGFTLEAAQKIADTNLPTIQLLADRGILQRTPAGRYEVHELLRQFAEEKLQQGKNFRDAYDEHSLYFARLLAHLETEMRSRRQAAALSRIEDEIENVQSAWRYALDQRDDATVATMLPSLYFFHETRGWFEEGEVTFGKAAECFTFETRTDQQTLLLGRLLARQGAFAHRLGHYKKAAQVLEASLSILRGTSAHEELAFTISFMADLSRSLGNYDASMQLCLKSLALFYEVDDKWGIAGELHNLGVAAYHLGDFGEASNYYNESLTRSRELDDPYGIVTSLIGIGALAQDQGNYEEAERLYAESLSISEALVDRYGIAASLINLGRVYYLTGDLQTGKQRCQKGLEICKELGDRWGIAAALINLGDISCGLENFQDSKAYFREALQIVTEMNSESLAIEIMVGMSALLMATGHEESALDLLIPPLNLPPDDKEIRERVYHLRKSLEENLSQETFKEILAQGSDKSIQAAIRQLFQLL